MSSDEESEVITSSTEPTKIIRLFSVETELERDLETMSSDNSWSESNVWVPDFSGEAEYDNEMRLQLDYERLLADLYDSSSDEESGGLHQLEPSDEEVEPRTRSQNLQMFEDSDFDFDNDSYPIRNDVFLSEASIRTNDESEIVRVADGQMG